MIPSFHPSPQQVAAWLLVHLSTAQRQHLRVVPVVEVLKLTGLTMRELLGLPGRAMQEGATEGKVPQVAAVVALGLLDQMRQGALLAVTADQERPQVLMELQLLVQGVVVAEQTAHEV
jgi:hypothetical protein